MPAPPPVEEHPMTALPAVTRTTAAAPNATTPAPVADGVDAALVDVMFPVVDDEQWPPYPAENVEAVLLAHDLAEIRSVPWFVTNLSRGDIVRVDHDGIGYVGRSVVSRGGRSTVHVLATDQGELAPLVEKLTALGAEVAGGLEPPMLVIDVPISVSLDDVLEVLVAAESATCAYEVASHQHPRRNRARTVA
jgi:Domain of unknown function (DUF4265)